MIRQALILFLLMTATAQAENLRKVDFIRVIDGDTIEVRYTTAIRLKDIDCFESKHNARGKWQAEETGTTEADIINKGAQSKQILKDLIKGNENNLYLQVKGLDRYRRILGQMYIGNDRNKTDINAYMLNKGDCLPYKPRPHKRKRKAPAPEASK